MKPLVSIIIPTYNRAGIIGETLESIIKQSFSDWECIIVDDGSIDSTEAVVKEYTEKDSRFKYYRRPHEIIKGANSCRNYGFKKSAGKYINWFDSDDLYLPTALNTAVGAFLENTAVVVCKLEFIDLITKSKIKESNILSTKVLEDYYLGKITFYISGPFWKRSFLENQKELFDEQISNLDDWDFNLRMLYQEPDINYVNQPLIQYRIHENSLSHEIGKLNFAEIKSDLNTREKHFRLNKASNKIETGIIRKDIRNKYKYFLRAMLVSNTDNTGYMLRQLLFNELKLYNFKGIIKNVLGYSSYKLFKKGYRFLS